MMMEPLINSWMASMRLKSTNAALQILTIVPLLPAIRALHLSISDTYPLTQNRLHGRRRGA